MSRGKTASQQVYDLFMATPEKGQSSYLHDHYRRGREGIMRPGSAYPLSDAAWRAGRDSRTQG